jgi:nucleotide-binding universal stress UspA family protein
MAVNDDARHIVVVGVDGSPESRIAAGYGLDEAVRRQAELRVVAVAPVPDYRSVAYGFESLPPTEEILAGVRGAAQKLVDEVAAARPGAAAGVPVTVHARIGHAGHELTEASAGADLLIVGHRGRGALASAVLGSVGLHCVLHARCPIMIVRPEAEPSATATPEHAPAAAD